MATRARKAETQPLLSRDMIEWAAADDPLFVAELVMELCEKVEYIAGLAHEDSSGIAHRALEHFKRKITERKRR